MNVLLCYQQTAVLSRCIQRRKGQSPAAFPLCRRVVLLWPPFFYGRNSPSFRILSWTSLADVGKVSCQVVSIYT